MSRPAGGTVSSIANDLAGKVRGMSLEGTHVAGPGLIDTILHRRNLLRWGRAARRAAHRRPLGARTERARAQALRQRLDELIVVAEGRLALPRIGSTSFPRPPGTDWSWRPRLWRGPARAEGPRRASRAGP